MRKSKFSDEQIVMILREANRDPLPIVAKRHGISEQTIYTWRKRFGTFQADDVRRLKRLEAENARLRKLVAERDLEIEVMKEINAKKMVSVPAPREQVAFPPTIEIIEEDQSIERKVERRGCYAFATRILDVRTELLTS